MDNKSLEQFVQKMYDLSFAQKQKSYSESELKEIALETGMSESDWEESRESFKRQKRAGLQHMAHKNYADAADAFEAAKALNPFDTEVLLYLALAYKGRADTGGSAADYDLAKSYAQSAIKAGSQNKEAYSLLSDIDKHRSISGKQRKKLFFASLLAVAIVLLIILFSWISIKNKVVSKEENVKEKWAQVENVYQRRADLIPALVKTVKAASNFEKELIVDVTEARSKVGSVNVAAGSLSQEQIDAFAEKQSELGGAVSRLLAVSENYPELKSLQNFRDLQAQIEGSENRISVERRRYNQEVRDYNSYIKKFPQSLLGFEEKGYFKADKSASDVPEIDL
jgi:LemA protein